MRKLLLPVAVVVGVFASVLPFVGCQPPPKDNPFGDSKVKVAVSFPALYSFAANVVGDTGKVISVKSTQGAHGTEVSADECRAVAHADVLFVNGLGLDDEFSKKLTAAAGTPNLKVVKLGNKLKHNLLLHWDGGECGEEGHNHSDSEHDPHCWLGIDQAVRFTEKIADALGDIYPEHKDTFQKNAAAYVVRLKAIKTDGEAKLSGTKREDRKLVTVHGSMGYFANTFGLTVVDTIQKSAGKEPSAAELKALVDKCKKERVRVIASEPQFSKLGAVGALAAELKGLNPEVIELDNLETATADDLKADWYETKMRANVEAVAKVYGK